MALESVYPSAMERAVKTARAAFTIHTTFLSHNWKQRQLYGLSQMLMVHREELIQALCEKDSSLRTKHEQELAVVLLDIARHYAGAAETPTSINNTVAQQIIPVGVSVLIVDSASPIRFLFSSLAANIALGNAIILTHTAQSLEGFWLILHREASKYLDPEAIQVLRSLDLDHGILDQVDLISVFAERSDPYDEILRLPNAQFISTRGGSSLVIVDEGSKSYDELTKSIIESYSFHSLRPEAVNAVFIRQTEMDEFRKSFSVVSSPSTKDTSMKSLDQTRLFTRFSSCSYSVELARLVGPGRKELGLAKAIQVAAEAGVLLVITYRSIDHAIDALRQLKPMPKYVTLLAPKDKVNLEYFVKWTASQFCSLGSIRPVFPNGSGTALLFPLELFGRSRVSFSTRRPELEQPLDRVLKTVQQAVKPSKEAPNQTVDFFQYVNRIATIAGLTVGSLCLAGGYLWYARKT